MYRKIEINLEEIKKAYQSGKSIREISKDYNCSPSSIRYHLIKMGTSLRPKLGIRHCVPHKGFVDESVFFNNVNTHKDNWEYFVGILATDGCISGNAVRLQLSEDNKEILQYWKEFLGNTVKIGVSLRKRRTYYSIQFKNANIVDYIHSIGITERKTFSIRLSYINWNVLRGIFDGDGCLVRDFRKDSSWKFSICSASLSFIEQINDFLIKNGTHPIIYKEKSYYTIHLGRLEDIFLVYSNIYKPNLYFLKRKYKKFCPLVEKFTRNHSVNSVKGKENHKTEPSPEWEGAETRNGVPKQE